MKMLMLCVFILKTQLGFMQQSFSNSLLPKPDHIVIVVFENKQDTEIIGSPYAPYINQLANDSNSAFFTRSYGITHPSQPNYLYFFFGFEPRCNRKRCSWWFAIYYT